MGAVWVCDWHAFACAFPLKQSGSAAGTYARAFPLGQSGAATGHEGPNPMPEASQMPPTPEPPRQKIAKLECRTDTISSIKRIQEIIFLGAKLEVTMKKHVDVLYRLQKAQHAYY